MTTEILIHPAIDSIADYKSALRQWKPRSDEQAGAFLAMRSMLTGKDGDAAKQAATERLLARCESRECDEIEFGGFRAKLVNKTVATYGPTKYDDKIEKLEGELKNLKTLRDAQRKIDGPIAEETAFSHFLIQTSK